jgi:hypothetical protein
MFAEWIVPLAIGITIAIASYLALDWAKRRFFV